MRNSKAVRILTVAAAALLLLGAPGCGKKKKTQVGTLKEWIVGDWSRDDDPSVWNFSAQNELITSGQLPITGTYATEEPDKVRVTVSGAGAVTASMMLGLKLNEESKTLVINFVLKDDEMRVSGVDSKTVFRKE